MQWDKKYRRSYTANTLASFVKGMKPKIKGRVQNGKCYQVWACASKSPAGVRYNRLARLVHRTRKV